MLNPNLSELPMPQQIRVPLDLTETERKRIAQAVCRELEASDEARQPMEDMWHDHEHMYQADQDAESIEVVKGLGGYAMPLWKPTLDRIVNHVYSAFFSLTPTVQSIDMSGQARNVEKLERTLDNIAQKQGLELEFKRALRCAGNTNIGTIVIYPVTDRVGRVTGLKSKYFNPMKIYAYPAESQSFAEVKTAGYSCTELRYRVKQKIQSGEYFECKLAPGDPIEGIPGSDAGTVIQSEAVTIDDEPIKIAVCVSELDLEQFRDEPDRDKPSEYKRYQLRIAVDTMELLKIDEYGSQAVETGEFKPYDSIGFVDVKLQPEEEDGMFGRYSLAYGMKALQDTFSDVFTTILQGNQMSAFGIPVIIGDTGGDKHEVLKPGEVLQLPASADVKNIAQKFDGNGLFSILEILFQLSDRFTGVGGLGAGQPTSGSTTATEVDALVDAIQAAKDQYTLGVSSSIARIYELNLMFLRHHYWDLKASYGDAIEISFEELQGLNVRLEVTGKTGASNPSMVLRKLFALKNLAMENPALGIDIRKVCMTIIDTMELVGSSDAFMLSKEDQMLMATMGLNPMELEAAKMVAQMNQTGMMPQQMQGGQGQPVTPDEAMLGGGQAIGDAQGGDILPY
jgi:hypothetical protein